MDFKQAVRTCLRQYATFSGRATRAEYWYFFLFMIIVSIVTSILDAMLFGNVSVLNTMTSLALLVPGLAVGARRLHDIDRSGWWLLIGLVPVIGWIVLIVWFCQKGTPGQNRFGPDPLRTGTEGARLARI